MQNNPSRQKNHDSSHLCPSNNRPVIGITMGDPAGIGPEIIVAALQNPIIQQICRPLVFGDVDVMKQAVTLKKSHVTIQPLHLPPPEQSMDAKSIFSKNTFAMNGLSSDTLSVLSLSDLSFDDIEPGVPTAETGRAMLNYITHAVDAALSGEIAAMVTAPITKTALKMAKSQFHGHTELIAHRTGTKKYAMMLAGDRLKVILVTIHTALASVPALLTPEAIIETIEIASQALQKNFGTPTPRIAVAGLNPHAGEDTMFGNEEEKAIRPAVLESKQRAKRRGESVTIEGPFPPDTLFHHAASGKYDCVVCMYHDQGLIPFKLLHFSDGVNTTLGLPIIRTSVDHGTAYDIAWKNIAEPTSLVQAIKMAVLQSKNR